MSSSGSSLVASALRECCLLAGVPANQVYVTERGALRAVPSHASKVILSYAQGFEALWGLDSQGLRAVANDLRRMTGALDLLLVWDGQPRGSNALVPTPRFLTPIDWAVAISRKILMDGGPLGGLRIFVLTIGLPEPVAPALRLVRAGNGTVPGMPWIALVPAAQSLAMSRNATLWSAVAPAAVNDVRLGADGYDSDADVTVAYWTAALASDADPENRHALSNVIGPLLVLGGAAASTGQADRRAMAELLASLGLLDSGTPATAGTLPQRLTSPWDNPMVRDRIGRLAGCRGALEPLEEPPATLPVTFDIMLIDDMWRGGWGEVACEMFAVPFLESDAEAEACAVLGEGAIGIAGHRARVRSMRSPVDFLTYIESSVEAFDGAPWPRRQLLAEAGSDHVPVLMLDLRLFAGRSLDDEAAFVRRVTTLVRRMQQRPPDGRDAEPHPWPAISEDELAEIDEWTTRASTAATRDATALKVLPAYSRSLALLARLVATIDPTLPVVIFSSTANRETLRALERFGSIQTPNLKPRIAPTGSWESREQFIAQRDNALVGALELHCVRAVCRRVEALREHLTTIPQHDHPIATSALDLYVDETGSEESELFSLGGVLVFGDSGGLEKFRRQAGVEVENRQSSPRELAKGTLRAGAASLLGALRDCAERCGVSFALVALSSDALSKSRTRNAQLGKSDPLRELRIGDTLWRVLLRRLVETCAVVLPRAMHSACGTPELRVFAGTRVLELSDKQLVELKERWGLERTWVGPDRGLHIARELMESWLDQYLPREAQMLATEAHSRIDTLAAKYPADTRVQMIGHSDVRAIVEQALTPYRDEYKLNVVIARAQSLNHVRRGAVQLHYAADALLQSAITAQGSVLGVPVLRGMNGRAVSLALRAHRALADRDAVSAFRHLCGVGQVPVARDGLTAALFRPFLDAVSCISGLEVLRLSRILGKQESS